MGDGAARDGRPYKGSSDFRTANANCNLEQRWGPWAEPATDGRMG
jgi:hypothetical protein